MELNGPQLTTLSQKTVMGLPVKKEVTFTNLKGVEKKSIKKRQLNLLKKLDFLPRFLKQGEEIYFVTTACSPISIIEQLTTGAIISYLKRSLLIFTNKRIIHIPTTIGYNFRHSIAQIKYGDCKKLSMGWRTLKVLYKNKKKENFLYIHGKERKKIRSLIEKVKTQGEPSRHQQRYHICPSCAKSLETGKYNCPKCRLEFKSKSRALLFSLLFPGGGYFYTSHWFMGLGDFIVESFLIYLIFSSYADPGASPGGEAGAGIVFLIILAIEKIITIYHASHYINEFIPVTTQYKRRSAA